MTRLLPPTYFLSAIVLILAAHFLVPIATLIPQAWRLVGVLPMMAGIALNILADRQFRKFHTTVKPLQTSSALITDGCFRWSRNPMYLGMVLIASGTAILEGSVSPWIVVVALAILLDRVFIVREEKMLAETFGTDFQNYQRRVRRWL
jgi:protein-S-isoprenylcysteine O-methyltransferase Ste14